VGKLGARVKRLDSGGGVGKNKLDAKGVGVGAGGVTKEGSKKPGDDIAGGVKWHGCLQGAKICGEQSMGGIKVGLI